jgi:ribonuclease G
MGTKGARITSHVSLPGRYLVLMPTVEHVGVSRKITDDEERRRLKTILKEFRQERGGGGLIARTAGQGREAEAFLRDGRYLARTWDEVRALASRHRAPVLLYREPSLLERLLRDLLSDDIASIRLDNEKEFQRTLELVRALEPSLASRVRLHDGTAGIMEEHGVQAELERALRSKVWLPTGGYIVINQTEALVAIDVNTGRFVGKNQLEETLLKANLDAVREIVRQIRLRDLGGIIVVDFIDMEERKSRREVMRSLEQEMRKDRSPTKLLSVNEFGLVILTRKRVKQSLERLLMQPCPYCSGSGQVKGVSTVCSEIYDEVKKLAADLHGQRLVLRVNPDVARALAGEEAPVLRSLASLTGADVAVQADALLHQEQFDVVTV